MQRASRDSGWMTFTAQSSCAPWATCACSQRCKCRNLACSSARCFSSFPLPCATCACSGPFSCQSLVSSTSRCILCIIFTALRKLCMLTAMLMSEPGIQFSQVHRSVSQRLGQAVHASGHAHTRAWHSVQPGALKHLPVPWATYHACWRPCSCQSHACRIKTTELVRHSAYGDLCHLAAMLMPEPGRQ